MKDQGIVKSKPILSICIGTYNRSKILEELLNKLIQIKREDLEIVIVDNASTDNTLEMLKQFRDARICVYLNKKNYGGVYNLLKPLERAKGKYAMYCNDRDDININEIDKLMDFLEKKDYSVIYTKPINSKGKEISDKMKKLKLFPTLHPTGVIYNKDIIERQSISIMKFLKYEDGVYLSCFLAREIKFYGACYEYPFKVWEEANSIFKRDNKSNFSNNNIIENLYFMPKSNMNQIRCLISQIKEFKSRNLINEREYSDLIYYYIGYYYNRIIFMNWYFCSSIHECQHYGIPLEKFSIIKYLKIGQEYSNSINSYIIEIPKKYQKYYKKRKIIFVLNTWRNVYKYNLKRLIKRILNYE